MDDEPIPELGNMPPASYASMPALSYMRTHGTTSRQQTIPTGLEPSTEVALTSILGIPVGSDFNARSWLEALGEGIDVGKEDLCLRCNLITHDNGTIVSHCGYNPTCEESRAIVDLLNMRFGDDDFKFYSFGNFRNLLVIRNCSSSIVARPPHTLLGQSVELLSVSSDNQNLESWLNSCIADSRDILKEHKANGISLWASSHACSFGKSVEGSVVAGVNIVKGIGRAAGMSVINVPGATGDEFTNYTAKLNAALNALKNDDFVLLHIEATDEASHQLDWRKKVEILEKIDRLILNPLLAHKGELRITVQADHATSSLTGQHLSIPVNVVNYIKNR